MPKTICLTGANGFIGRRLSAVLHADPKISLTAVVRRYVDLPASHITEVQSLGADTDWSRSLCNQHVVIHTAARAHIVLSEEADPLSVYRRVNVEGTLNLARQAASLGVERFIFISSIGVIGNISSRTLTEDDRPNPVSLNAQSKWEAEQGLWAIQCETGMEIVIIRPSLVYGPSAPGNFGTLVRWIENGFPLPLGAIHNRRSLVALDNLVDLIVTCIDHPAAANQVFLAGDGEDLSTTELLRGVSKAAGKTSRLIPVSSSFLMLAAILFGKRAMAQSLLGSLQVDISKARELLDWVPPVSVEEGLRRCFSKD